MTRDPESSVLTDFVPRRLFPLYTFPLQLLGCRHCEHVISGHDPEFLFAAAEEHAATHRQN